MAFTKPIANLEEAARMLLNFVADMDAQKSPVVFQFGLLYNG